MKMIVVSVFMVLLGMGGFAQIVSAQSLPEVPKQEFVKATVTKIVRDTRTGNGDKQVLSQMIQVRLLDGPEKGKMVQVEHGGRFTITESQKVSQGQTIILRRTSQDKTVTYYVSDAYRLPQVAGILVLFFIIVFGIAGRKGLGALIGMVFSLSVIMWFIIPQILKGSDPLTISIVGSVGILGVTMYLAHGFSKQTHIAVFATALSLALTAMFAIMFVSFAHLSGLGSEDAYSLQQGFGMIQFRGLLLGGIIIGTLGVLDDVTATQAATIHELAESDPKQSFKQLVSKGMKVGREHIASVVNTLVLAYAGASIGIFIYLYLGMQQQAQPLWVMLNSEVIMEEVIRTIAGSLGLILAVPITTLLAAFFAKNDIKII